MELLILGVGNVLYRDEALGVKAMQLLAKNYTFQDNVTIHDGGTLGLGLMEILMSCDLAIIIDTVTSGYEPGTLYRLEGEDLRKSISFADSMHQTDLVDTLIMCDLAGKRPDCIVFGMEPLDIETLDTNLSPIIEANMPRLITEILKELTKLGISYTEKK